MGLKNRFNTWLAQQRRDYQYDQLSPEKAPENPLVLFDRWLTQAQKAELPEPHAMTVSTVNSQLRPSSRIVLLKEYDETGFVWFTNYHSRKGLELAGNPFAALLFHWVQLERVVRIEGQVTALSDEDNDTYFLSRPLASRIGAWASPQSQSISSRLQLMTEVARYSLRWGLNPPRPPHWGGYRLIPDQYEFWQGRPHRLHDRLLFVQAEEAPDTWRKKRLAP
jgi:pyridoxamine 5'-phosphate oxidase